MKKAFKADLKEMAPLLLFGTVMFFFLWLSTICRAAEKPKPGLIQLPARVDAGTLDPKTGEVVIKEGQDPKDVIRELFSELLQCQQKAQATQKEKK